MAARLGMILYWFAAAIALLLVLAGIAAIAASALGVAAEPAAAAVAGGVSLVIALLVYLFGRACRYVLAGF